MKHALALLVIAAAAAGASADDALPKKDRARAAKSPQHGPVPKPGTKPAPLVNLYNSWTHEWLAIEAKRLPSQDTIDRFLRDHFTNAPTKMEARLVEMVASAARNFRSDVAIIVSAFRHPKYNLILRKKGHQVARDSQHTHGNAIDFYLPRIPTLVLHDWAKAQRLGGVGLYTGSGFIHMDTGQVRYWSGE
ncbi:MAG TPA: DUF882 domain-containing protein [Kofleriaceae bacterium]|nr:DUF882 domain-containing protein [Kofleriaceae bacterium]